MSQNFASIYNDRQHRPAAPCDMNATCAAVDKAVE